MTVSGVMNALIFQESDILPQNVGNISSEVEKLVFSFQTVEKLNQLLMSRYSKCPHCKNPKTGLDIYKCTNCGRIACYYDGIFGFGATGCWQDHSRCPDCKQKHKMKKVGDVWRG